MFYIHMYKMIKVMLFTITFTQSVKSIGNKFYKMLVTNFIDKNASNLIKIFFSFNNNSKLLADMQDVCRI